MSATAGGRARQARELFRAARSGVLSSHSVKFPGFPMDQPCRTSLITKGVR
jgi:hypothetical protein